MCVHCYPSAEPVHPAPRHQLHRRRFLLLAGASSVVLAGCGPGATGLGLDLVPQEQVEQMGLETWERLRAEEPATDNQEYQQRAERIARRILEAAGEDPGAWEIVVFQGDQANAFALPGNKMGVYEGMFEVAEDDAQLAAVIGHEIGHNQAEHAAERISTQVAAEAGLRLVSAALGAGDVGYANLVAGALGAGVQYGVLMPYNRNQELEADEIGLRNMAQAGYDPREAIAFWERMRQAAEARPPEFLSTHPAPDARIAALEQMMPEAVEIYEASA